MSATYREVKVFEDLQTMDKVFEEKAIRILRIGDQKICIAKQKSSYFAFEALCPHQKQPLSEGTLNSFNEIICPLHFYRFNLKTGREANVLCSDLKVYPITSNEEGVFIRVF